MESLVREMLNNLFSLPSITLSLQLLAKQAEDKYNNTYLDAIAMHIFASIFFRHDFFHALIIIICIK